MRNEAGDMEATKKGIANTFAKFYEDLYSNQNDERKDEEDNEARLENTYDQADDGENIEEDERDRHIPEFTIKELSIAIGCLKKGKSADSRGIKAEELKGTDEETTKNDLCCPEERAPDEARKLQTDLFPSTTSQALLNHDIQPALRQARSTPVPRPGPFGQ